MASGTPAREGTPRRILLVEDDPDIRISLQTILTEEGFDVVACNNGREALSRLGSMAAPDLIILDLMMPVMDGWQFRIQQKNDPSIAQVSLVSKEKNWDRPRRGDFHYVKRGSALLGPIKSPWRKTVTAFTTSPAFTRGNFARQWAALMDEKLDPEKQTYMGINPPLEKFVSPFRNYLYPGKINEITITDTGREWRESQNIEKKIIEGKSVWTAP
jgi:CheY-like chemotaxis protein